MTSVIQGASIRASIFSMYPKGGLLFLGAFIFENIHFYSHVTNPLYLCPPKKFVKPLVPLGLHVRPYSIVFP